MDCSLPGSSVHGFSQAEILEWVAISFSRGSSQLRDWTWVSCIAGRHFTIWATRKVPQPEIKPTTPALEGRFFFFSKQQIYYIMGFPCGSAGKESAFSEGDLGSIPGLGRSPGERKGYPLQYSGLENSMDCIVHGVAKSQTRLSNFHFHFSILQLCRPEDWHRSPWANIRVSEGLSSFLEGLPRILFSHLGSLA